MISEPINGVRRGFALPAVLAVIGVVTIVFLVAMTALSSLNAEAASARDRVRFTQRALTAEATLAYMMSTEPFGPLGMRIGAPRALDPFLEPEDMEALSSGAPTQDLRLDGSPYLLDVGGPMMVSLRDQAGMVNLAYLTPDQAERLAEQAGAPRGFGRTLLARYRDYADPDDLRQVDGAESSEYGGDGPANRNLLRADEFLSILGVRQAVDSRKWRALRDALAVDAGVPRANVNTASADALEILFGATPQQAQAAIRARQQAPFLSFQDFVAASGVPDLSNDEILYTFPAGKVFFTLRDGRSAWIYRGRISLTPSGLERPVWIDQTDTTEAPRRVAADTSNATRFPYAPR